MADESDARRAVGARTFGDLWESYARKVLPQDAGEVQRRETQRAFYSGGIALLSTLMRMVTDGLEPTDDDLQLMSDLQAEFDAYACDVREGRA